MQAVRVPPRGLPGPRPAVERGVQTAGRGPQGLTLPTGVWRGLLGVGAVWGAPQASAQLSLQGVVGSSPAYRGR